MAALTSLHGNRQIGAADNIRQNLSSDQAAQDFAQLRTLVGRNSTSKAQIKLVHTTDAQQLMQFETKGWWARLFRPTAKLVNTNAAILELVKKTGIPETSNNFQNLKRYLDEKTQQQRAGSARGLHGYLEGIQRELARKPASPVATADTVKGSLAAQGYEFKGLDSARGFVGSGGHGRIYAEADGATKGLVYKEFHEIMGDAHLPRLKVRVDAEGAYQMDRNAKELAAASLRDGKVPHVASPIAYVIKDAWDEVFHAVSAGHLKAWVSENGQRIADAPDRFVITGQVLPKAEGASGTNLKGLTPADKQAIARQGLEALKSMAQHGYVHGDIKPDNLMYDAEAKRMQLIDFGGLIKQSKHDQSGQALGNPLSPRYVIPSHHHQDGANDKGGYGYEADLYAFGLTLLNIALPGAQQVQALSDSEVLHDRDAIGGLLQGLRQNEALIRSGSTEDLAISLMEWSLEQSTPLTGRLGSGDGALEHLWQRIQDHPAIAERS